MSIRNLVYENRSRDECLLKGVKSITTEEIELRENILLDKIYQWNNNIWAVENELMIEVNET